MESDVFLYTQPWQVIDLQQYLAGLEGSISNPDEAEILQILAEWEEELKKNGSPALQPRTEVQP